MTYKRTPPQHGTHSKYGKGCRCQPCLEAHRIYERNAARRRRRIRYGLEAPNRDKVDATEARDHVKFLVSRGIGLGTIAQQVGTNRSTIQYVKRGKYSRMSASLSNRILGVSAIPKNPNAYVDAKPLRDLVAVLRKHGIFMTDIARAMGVKDDRLVIRKHIRLWRYQKIEQVCQDMLRKVQ